MSAGGAPEHRDRLAADIAAAIATHNTRHLHELTAVSRQQIHQAFVEWANDNLMPLIDAFVEARVRSEKAAAWTEGVVAVSSAHGCLAVWQEGVNPYQRADQAHTADSGEETDG